MVPHNITRESILQAIAEVDREAVPEDRHSTRFSVQHEGFLYPPKYLVSVAHRLLTGQEWPPERFTGGEETNAPLRAMGFEIVEIPSSTRRFPIESTSWQILSPSVAVKLMDRSSFLHHGSGLSSEVRTFFGIHPSQEATDQRITLCHRGREYQAHFQFDSQHNRWRIFWRADLVAALRAAAPEWYNAFEREANPPGNPPTLRFQALDHTRRTYKIEVIVPDEIEQDAASETPEEVTPRTEGAQRQYYGTRYERDPVNRRRAIEHHGTNCSACGFDFARVYGSRGIGYIEVHHTRPLGDNAGPVSIDPRTDLVPVCANCHRMIHRRRDYVLSLADIRGLLAPNRTDMQTHKQVQTGDTP
jgi:5-methylcytosine-specific restriction protein A